MIFLQVSLHDEDDPQRLDPSYKVILLIIPFYFIFRRIHEFGILYSFNKSSKRLEQKREELKRKYKELKKVFGYEKVATVNEKNAIKKNTECIKESCRSWEKLNFQSRISRIWYMAGL